MDLIASRSYYHNKLTWCVQKQKPIPSWIILFYACTDLRVHLTVFIQSIAIVMLLYYMEQFERYPKSDWYKIITNGFACFLGFACEFKPTILLSRLVYFLILLANIVFTATINGVLVLFVTSPILNPQVQNIQEIIGQKYIIMGDRFTLYQISQQNEVNLFDLIFSMNVIHYGSLTHYRRLIQWNFWIASR